MTAPNPDPFWIRLVAFLIPALPMIAFGYAIGYARACRACGVRYRKILRDETTRHLDTLRLQRELLGARDADPRRN